VETANQASPTLTWRGDTVVEISPKGTICPLYQREHFKQEKAPMKATTFYFPEEELPFPKPLQHFLAT
jgi:hypothetical protein